MLVLKREDRKFAESKMELIHKIHSNTPALFLLITCHKIPCVPLSRKLFSHRHDHHLTATLLKGVYFTVPLGAMVTKLA